MSRKTDTHLTFELRMRQPAGSNMIDMREYVLAAMAAYKAQLPSEDPRSKLDVHQTVCKFLKKETLYL